MWPHNVLCSFDRLTRCPSRPNTWKARCPAHDDRTPSLSLWLGRNGALLVRCWACRGCTVEDITRRAGLTMTDLFPPDSRADGPYAREGAGPRSRPAAPKPKIVATYDYTDEAGKLLYQSVRYEPKEFRQRRPCPEMPTGWVWSLGDVRRVLYRLPRIVQSAGTNHPVVVVEGEKDVHTLEELGLIATTCPMGAGKWLGDYSLSLVGRRVVILPDADQPGQEHAVHVAGSLMMAGAASIRVVELPDLPAHGDVSDWVGQGNTLADLVQLVRESREWVARAA